MKKVQFCEKTGLKRGKWSHEEDHQLISYIKNHGIWNWKEMAKAARLLRTGKSCRLRWMNYLKPDLKHGSFTKEEDEIIMQMYATMGSKWSRIAARLPGRSDNDIKNHWHTNLRKKGKRRNKMKRDHRFKERNFSITIANNYDEPYNNITDQETNFISSFEPPLSVEDYEIEETMNMAIEDTPTSSDQMYYSSSPSSSIARYQYEEEMGCCGSCKTIQDDQDEKGYWDMLLMMVSENQFPQFESPLQGLFTNSELYFQV